MLEIEKKRAAAAAPATSSHDEKEDVMNKKGAVEAEAEEQPSKFPGGGLCDGDNGSLKSPQLAAQLQPLSSIPSENDKIDDLTLNKIFAEKFQRRQEKQFRKKLISRIRQPCVMFTTPYWMKGVNEETMRHFFDERYVIDDRGLDPADLAKYETGGMGIGDSDAALRSELDIDDDEPPKVIAQTMRESHVRKYSIDYVNSDVLVDPSNFEVYSEIEKMHYKLEGGRMGYTYHFDNWSGAGEPLADVLGYNVRVMFCAGSRPLDVAMAETRRDLEERRKMREGSAEDDRKK